MTDILENCFLRNVFELLNLKELKLIFVEKGTKVQTSEDYFLNKKNFVNETFFNDLTNFLNEIEKSIFVPIGRSLKIIYATNF